MSPGSMPRFDKGNPKFHSIVPGRRTPTQTSPFPPRDRAGRPTTPEKGPHPKEIRRSASTTSDLDSHKPTHVPKKAITAGPHTGAKLAQKLKMLDGKRARVLPNESVDVAEADKKIAKETGRRCSEENTYRLYSLREEALCTLQNQIQFTQFVSSHTVDILFSVFYVFQVLRTLAVFMLQWTEVAEALEDK